MQQTGGITARPQHMASSPGLSVSTAARRSRNDREGNRGSYKLSASPGVARCLGGSPLRVAWEQPLT